MILSFQFTYRARLELVNTFWSWLILYVTPRFRYLVFLDQWERWQKYLLDSAIQITNPVIWRNQALFLCMIFNTHSVWSKDWKIITGWNFEFRTHYWWNPFVKDLSMICEWISYVQSIYDKQYLQPIFWSLRLSAKCGWENWRKRNEWYNSSCN